MVSCTPASNLKANGEMEITQEKIEGEAPLPSCQMPGQGATEGKDAFEATSLNRIHGGIGARQCSKLMDPSNAVRQRSFELA